MSFAAQYAAALARAPLVMTAVFVPVTFMSGPVGVFYRQFSITMAVAIVLSGVMALTLTPVLCGMLLKRPDPTHGSRGPLGFLLARFNTFFEKVTDAYTALLRRIVHRWVLTLIVLAGAVVAIQVIGSRLPVGFIPAEDQGMIYAIIQTPPGSTLSRRRPS